MGVISATNAIEKLTGARILLVEDNEMNQELALELLQSNGLIAELAENGQVAIEKIQKGNFDGVLMDCQMPVMDGYTATKAIRKMDQFNSLPIIAMTANAMAGDREKVIAAGMNDHIAKPINVDEMFSTMANWIKPSNPAKKTIYHQTGEVEISLPEFSAIDTAAGLATTQNNSKLYFKLLQRFAKSNQDFLQQFNQALNDTDPTAATRCAHTIKGTAGNIGAFELQRAAAKLEHQCELVGGTADMPELDSVIEALKQVLADLEQLTPSEESTTTTELDVTRLHPLLHELEQLVADYDTDATEIIEQLDHLLQGSRYSSSLNKVADYIDNYDFEQAGEQLQKLVTEFSQHSIH